LIDLIGHHPVEVRKEDVAVFFIADDRSVADRAARQPGPWVSRVPSLLSFNETLLESGDQFLGRADANEA
jgi:hypothetical protein